MKMGAIQFEPLFGEVGKNLELARSLIMKSDADLLVLPELFNTGYVFTSREETISLSEEIPDGMTTQMLCDVDERKGHLHCGWSRREERRQDIQFGCPCFP